MATKKNPMEILNGIREKAKLNDEDFTKSIAIRLKPGKIKFQLVAKDDEHLFRPRTQHMIPTVPNEEDKNEKWLVADCKGEGCPVCQAAAAFKNAGIGLDEINEAYHPKYPYKYVKSLFTQSEHYLLFAKVLLDQADEGNYLPKDADIGSYHLLQFPRTALNNLMAAYEDAMDDAMDDELDESSAIPPLFAIFNGDKSASSLTITARITNQPYSCTFSFNKVAEINIDEVDKERMALLEEPQTVSDEHYEKCVKRIKQIQNYFIKPKGKAVIEDEDDSDLPFSLGDSEVKKPKKLTPAKDDDDDDLDIDDLL